MTVKGHVFMSWIPAAGYMAATGDMLLGSLALAASILIDFDHVIDRVVEERKITSLQTMAARYMNDDFEKVYLIFHSLDLLIPALLLVGMSNPVGAVLVGFIFHILCDIYEWCLIRRKVSWLTYFFIYRVKVHFLFRRMLTRKYVSA